MSTPLCIIGTIATVPRVGRSSSGIAYCTFRVASNERRYDREKGHWVDGDTNWVTVNSFRSLAEHAGKSFSKGDRVVVSGRLRVRKWVNGEKRGTAVEVEAEAVGHDLRFGTSRFTKLMGSEAEDGGRNSVHEAVAAHPAGGDFRFAPAAAAADAATARRLTAGAASADDAVSTDAGPGSPGENVEGQLEADGFTPYLTAA